MEIVIGWLPQLVMGLQVTIGIAARVITIASIFGVVGGVGLLYAPRPVRLLLRGYVDFVRGLPVLVLIFAVYYVPTAFRISVDSPTAAVAALSMFGTAHISEIVRGGIGSLPRLQLDAAKALGLTATQRFRLVVMPLAIPRMAPAWSNTAVEVFKGTSLASLIGAPELLYVMQSAVGTTFRPLPFYTCGAAIYFAGSFGLSRLSAAVERHYRFREY
jgi:polar amino acid transport system permease protein